jgi:hypothetical protein
LIVALTPETGLGVTGADSYFALTASTAYWTARPHDALGVAWLAASSANQDGAAREATAYLDGVWGALYRGSRKTTTQGLLWPRVSRTVLDPTVYDSLDDFEAAQAETDAPIIGADGLELAALPIQIVNAAIELAARALTARLAQDKTDRGWKKLEKVGPITDEWGGPGIPGGSYGFVDDMLRPVLIGQRNASWAWA